MADYANVVGNMGGLCFLIAFFLLQKEKLSSKSLTYLLLNLTGSQCLIYSLVFHWNLPSFLLEAAWTMISMYGIYKYHLSPRRRKR